MLRRVGHGSYGEVWLARSTLGTPRAVKVVYRSDFEEARPYEREYSGIRKYEPISRSHEGLVDVLQVGRNDEEGYFYYVMELADSLSAEAHRQARTLSQPATSLADATVQEGGGAALDVAAYEPKTLSAERRRRGRFPARECIELGCSLSAGLAALHRGGLIHRDIKPSNIIFVGGVAKLADIGLVTDASESGSYVGTEGFIPPEGPNSTQADVYSLGKVLYEVGMGRDRLDFPEPPSDFQSVPDRDALLELNAVLLKACQPDRRLRHASAAELEAELELLRRGRSVRQKRRSAARLRGMTQVAIAVGVLTLLALAAERVLDGRARALQGASSRLRPSLVGRVEPRPPGLPERLIDLTSAYTAPLTERWYPGPADNTLSLLPRGRQTFAGVEFDVRGLVQLAGVEIAQYGADGYPARVGGILVERWVRRFHFLHGAVSEMTEGSAIGSYRVYYNTGRQVDVPLVYGRNVRALWQPRRRDPALPEAEMAWRGENPATAARDMELRLYRFTWTNAWPAEEIVAIDFNSAQANAAPLLVALTAEDAPLTIEERRASLSLADTIQKGAVRFPAVTPLAEGAPFSWTPLELNRQPLEIEGRQYDGFRFVVPRDGSPDLVWAFRQRQASLQGWFILPMTGGLKVGFEDWYRVTPSRSQGDKSPGREFVVQFLSGKKLEPGREYCIWFGADTNRPVSLEFAFRFAPPASVDPNAPESLLRALGLTEVGGTHSFLRHYCLSAMR